MTTVGLLLGVVLATALIAQQAAELRAGAGRDRSARRLPVAVLAAVFVAVVVARLVELMT